MISDEKFCKIKHELNFTIIKAFLLRACVEFDNFGNW